ncbi:50S ribosomal protein L29 [Candidatus Kaiserbacteria bacterium]|nr:50S ribosomal protein L29 [Candidatus Kaiserbacteria bacterium]
MKKTDFKKYSADDLKKEVTEKREALRTFRFGEAGSRSRNVKEGRSLRRDIARLLTELRARSLASNKKSA